MGVARLMLREAWEAAYLWTCCPGTFYGGGGGSFSDVCGVGRTHVICFHPPSLSTLALPSSLSLLAFPPNKYSEWLTNQHRDTYATHLGHHDQLAYIAVAQNDAVGRVRYQMLEKMLQPCGPPPAAKEDEDED